MTNRKREIKRHLLTGYDIKAVKEIQDALKNFLGITTKEMIETEMGHHLRNFE